MKSKMYLHSSKEGNRELWEEIFQEECCECGCTCEVKEPPENFIYALYEVEFDVDIDENTGKVMIEKVNGMPLVTPIKG